MNKLDNKLDTNIALFRIIGKKLAEDVKFFVEEVTGPIMVRFRANKNEVHNEIYKATSEDFKEWLRLNYIKNKNNLFSHDYKKLMSTINYYYNFQINSVFERLAKINSENSIYIDLCNLKRNVIKISDAHDILNVEIIKEDNITAPIVFRRTRDMKEIPEPQSKDLKGLLSLLIHLDDQELWSVLCWLTVTFDHKKILSLLNKKIEILRSQRSFSTFLR